MIENFFEKRVVVMGLGRFGGGVGAARWLAEQGARVTVTDTASSEALAGSVAELSGLNITFHLGGHDAGDLDGCDLLVVSPAVPKDRSSFVADAMARGIPLSSEMNLFIERCPARRMIGITGSAGKSTTTAMLGAVLQAAHPAGVAGQAWMGGNIGRSLLSSLHAMHENDVVLLELSSFQLEDLGPLRWSPDIAFITNIQPNHLDRHGTLEAYADAKLNIVRYQKNSDKVFVHRRDDELAERVRNAGGGERLQRFEFDSAFARVLRVPGPHNRDNAAAAIAMARAMGIKDDVIARGLEGFKGLPHRLELVAEINGVRFFNDSKSTTPESTRIALRAFDEPLVVLVGGRGKGIPFDELSRHLAKRAKAVICYGETGNRILEEVVDFAEPANAVDVELAVSFEHAVALAKAASSPGDVVVLSPACTSYDMFTNYEQRGDTFRRLVHAI